MPRSLPLSYLIEPRRLVLMKRLGYLPECPKIFHMTWRDAGKGNVKKRKETQRRQRLLRKPAIPLAPL